MIEKIKNLFFFNEVKAFYKILPLSFQRAFKLATLLICFTAFLELVILTSLLPFLTLLIEPSKFLKLPFSNYLSSFFSVDDVIELLTYFGLFYLILIIFSFLITIYVTFFRTDLIRKLKTYVVKSLFRKYLNQSYSWHANKNSSELFTTIHDAVNRGIDISLSSFLIVINSFTMIIFLILGFFMIQPLLTFILLVALSILFVILHYFRNRFWKVDGNELSTLRTSKAILLQESFSGIKEIKVYGLEDYFCEQIPIYEKKINKLQQNTTLLSFYPRQFVECLILIVAVAGSLLLIQFGKSPQDYLIPLSIMLFVLLRLFPLSNLIFIHFNFIKDNIVTLKKITFDLTLPDEKQTSLSTFIKLNNYIEGSELSFSYLNSNLLVLDKIDFKIKVGHRVGIIGETGSGKSTLVNLILGVLSPCKGKILIDDKEMTPTLREQWKQSIGYVPQETYLLDDTIWKNIALGENKENVDIEKVRKVSELAEIADFIEELKDKYDTKIGEKGIRLSGGQRQRIAIARALYRNPSLLVLDEATSSLDTATEEAIMQSIHKLSNSLTIIMVAHRISTLKNCHKIYKIKDGKILNTSYDEEK